MYNCSVFLSPFRSIAQRIFDNVLPYHKTMPPLLREAFPILVTFQLLLQKYVIQTSLCILEFHSVCIHVEYIPKILGSSKSTFFIDLFHMGAILRFLPYIFMSSTFSDKNNPCFLLNKQTFPIWYFFPSKLQVERPRNVFSHDNPAYECPYKFRSRRTTGSSMFAHDFGHLCVMKDVSIYLDILTLEL